MISGWLSQRDELPRGIRVLDALGDGEDAAVENGGVVVATVRVGGGHELHDQVGRILLLELDEPLANLGHGFLAGKEGILRAHVVAIATLEGRDLFLAQALRGSCSPSRAQPRSSGRWP